jgi:hypothetical protein
MGSPFPYRRQMQQRTCRREAREVPDRAVPSVYGHESSGPSRIPCRRSRQEASSSSRVAFPLTRRGAGIPGFAGWAVRTGVLQPGDVRWSTDLPLTTLVRPLPGRTDRPADAVHGAAHPRRCPECRLGRSSRSLPVVECRRELSRRRRARVRAPRRARRVRACPARSGARPRARSRRDRVSGASLTRSAVARWRDRSSPATPRSSRRVSRTRRRRGARPSCRRTSCDRCAR